MGFLNLFGKRMIKISSIYMLPKGRKATNDLHKLLLEECTISVVWKMLEHDYSWYKGELKFGYVPPKLEDAYIMQRAIKDILVNQAKFTENSIRCPYKVDKLEWQQTLWRFYWLWQIAIADMENIWNIVKDPTNFLSIEERNDYLRDIAFISAIPPGRVMILDKHFSKLVGISQKVRELLEEAKKYNTELKEPISLLWFFSTLSEDRAIYIFTEEEIK
jgi:hypothetical protein